MTVILSQEIISQFPSNFVLFFVIIISSIILLGVSNPIYSLLALIMIFVCVIILLLFLNVEFLALILLIIYVGAVAILFLFVIMMFNLKKLQQQTYNSYFWCTSTVYAIIIPKMYLLITEYISKFLLNCDKLSWNTANMSQTIFTSKELLYITKYKTNDILIFSDLFYNYYCYIIILLGLLLLTAMLGSIILAFATVPEQLNKK